MSQNYTKPLDRKWSGICVAIRTHRTAKRRRRRTPQEIADARREDYEAEVLADHGPAPKFVRPLSKKPIKPEFH